MYRTENWIWNLEKIKSSKHTNVINNVGFVGFEKPLTEECFAMLIIEFRSLFAIEF